MYDSRSQQKHKKADKHQHRPILTRVQAFHEGWMDLMDVRDEQAIAEDGLAHLERTRPHFDVPRRFAPLIQGAVATVMSAQYDVPLTVRLNANGQAKVRTADPSVLRNHDIDPYTGRPYSGDIRPRGFVSVSSRRK